MPVPNVPSKLIYGTAWKRERTDTLVVSAVLQGFRAIDTASQPKHYREDLVGRALKELQERHKIRREHIWLQTKYTPMSVQDPGQPLPYNPSDPISEQIAVSLATSLKNLNTNFIDSYLIQAPLRSLEDTLEAWRTLALFQDQGKVGMVGICNTYDARLLVALDRVRKIQVVQNRWCERNEWDKNVVIYCRDRGIMYQPVWAISGSPSLLAHRPLIAVAQASGISREQMLLKVAQDVGLTPLSGTTKESHMKDNLAVEKLRLNLNSDLQEEYDAIWAMVTGYQR